MTAMHNNNPFAGLGSDSEEENKPKDVRGSVSKVKAPKKEKPAAVKPKGSVEFDNARAPARGATDKNSRGQDPSREQYPQKDSRHPSSKKGRSYGGGGGGGGGHKLDRHSGTGRGPKGEMKKGGRGNHNWGNENDDIERTGEEGESAVPASGDQDSSRQVTNENMNGDDTEVAEQEPETMTFAEYEAKVALERAELEDAMGRVKLREVDDTEFQGGIICRRQDVTADDFLPAKKRSEGSNKEKSKKISNKKGEKFVDVGFSSAARTTSHTNQISRRGGRGTREGRRGRGYGGRGSNNTGHRGRAENERGTHQLEEPQMMDTSFASFPKLG